MAEHDAGSLYQSVHDSAGRASSSSVRTRRGQRGAHAFEPQEAPYVEDALVLSTAAVHEGDRVVDASGEYEEEDEDDVDAGAVDDDRDADFAHIMAPTASGKKRGRPKGVRGVIRGIDGVMNTLIGEKLGCKDVLRVKKGTRQSHARLEYMRHVRFQYQRALKRLNELTEEGKHALISAEDEIAALEHSLNALGPAVPYAEAEVQEPPAASSSSANSARKMPRRAAQGVADAVAAAISAGEEEEDLVNADAPMLHGDDDTDKLGFAPMGPSMAAAAAAAQLQTVMAHQQPLVQDELLLSHAMVSNTLYYNSLVTSSSVSAGHRR